jgi:hypothetical protein
MAGSTEALYARQCKAIEKNAKEHNDGSSNQRKNAARERRGRDGWRDAAAVGATRFLKVGSASNMCKQLASLHAQCNYRAAFLFDDSTNIMLSTSASVSLSSSAQPNSGAV